MVGLSKKLGKLSLAILENFVEGVLGEKFVDELRLPTDRAIAIATALGETEDLFIATFGDKDLSRALFVDLSQRDRPDLKNAVGKYFDHPTDPSLRQSLQKILFDEFKNLLAKEEIDKAVDFYIRLLTKELMLVDEAFRDNIAALMHYEGNLAEQRSTELLEQIAARIMQQQNASQSVIRSLHQLPPVPVDFTGREEIIEQLLSDLNSNKGTTISGLIGMGGIGKTVLGLEVAHKIANSYPDAQIFLDLKGTTTPLSAVDIARHVILSFEPTADLRTIDDANMFSIYQSTLHGKKALLFFDNARSAEQIAPVRPPETCGTLITSRWMFTVPGLNTRSVGNMSEDEAKKFLTELCPRIGDKAVELAKACAYLPLALRIAGSFLHVNSNWSVEKYLTQLEDRKQRLTTLKESRDNTELTTEPDLVATFELSYNQLSEENQKHWCMLGAFPSSFNLNAVQNVWKLEEIETAKLLSLLRRYNLLDYDENSYRYYLHDLLADYALEQMNVDERVAAYVAHSLHYSKLLSDITDLFLKGGDSFIQSLKIYDTERINLEEGQRISAEYLEGSYDASMACNNYALQGSINDLRQKPNDHIRWLENGLKAAQVLGNKGFIGSHLGNLGSVYSRMGHISKAIGFYTQHLAIARETGNRKEEGGVWGNLGVAYSELGKDQAAAKFYERALEIAHEIGDRHYESIWLGNLGNLYVKLGNITKATEFFEQHLSIAREIGDLQGESIALGNLGLVYSELEETSKAVELFTKSIEISRKIGYYYEEARALGGLGLLYTKVGDFNKAIVFFRQHYEIAHGINDRLSEIAALENLGHAYTVLHDFQKAIECYEQVLIIDREIDSRKRELAHLNGLGDACASLSTLDNIRKAIGIYEQLLAIAREINDPEYEGRALAKLGFLNYNIGQKEKGIMLAEQGFRILEAIGAPAQTVNAIRNTLKQWGVEGGGSRKRRRVRKR